MASRFSAGERPNSCGADVDEGGGDDDDDDGATAGVVLSENDSRERERVDVRTSK